MPDPSDSFRAFLSGTRATRTVATYMKIATELLATVGTETQPTPTNVEAFLGRARQDGLRRSVATRNQELAALRAFAKFACGCGIWDQDPTAGVPFLREPRRDPTVLSAAEVRRLFEAANGELNAFRRARNLALLAVLSQAGLRVHELVTLDVSQVDLVGRTLLDVRGKGGTRADVPLNAEAASLLAAWLQKRPPTAGDALFLSLRGTRLSIRAVERLLVQLRSRTGTRKRITPHTLRHSAATIALVLGADLSTVGDLLRHADLNTTRRYLHLVDERKREAVRRLGSTVPSSVLPESGGPFSEFHDKPAGQSAAPVRSGVDDQYPLGDASAGRMESPQAPNPAGTSMASPPGWPRAA